MSLSTHGSDNPGRLTALLVASEIILPEYKLDNLSEIMGKDIMASRYDYSQFSTIAQILEKMSERLLAVEKTLKIIQNTERVFDA